MSDPLIEISKSLLVTVVEIQELCKNFVPPDACILITQRLAPIVLNAQTLTKLANTSPPAPPPPHIADRLYPPGGPIDILELAKSWFENVQAILKAVIDHDRGNENGAIRLIENHAIALRNSLDIAINSSQSQPPTCRLDWRKKLSGSEAVQLMRNEFVELVEAYNTLGLYGRAADAQILAVKLHEFQENNRLEDMVWPVVVIAPRDTWPAMLRGVKGEEITADEL
jgi:hypothetical protein